MRVCVAAVITLYLLCGVALSFATPDPRANPAAVVIADNRVARFTVLTSQLIRLEYAGDGNFNDNATFAIINRLAPLPYFTNTTDSQGLLTIKTENLTLTYDTTSTFDGFSDTNLQITLNQPLGGEYVNWNISSQPTGNLLGTVRTLDDTDGPIPLYCPGIEYMIAEQEHCALGVVSVDGWAMINDTKMVTLDNGERGWQWWNNPPPPNDETCAMSETDRYDCNPGNTGAQPACESLGCCYNPVLTPNVPWCFYPLNPIAQQDLYFFGHGHDYYQAVHDYNLVSGQVTMFPRFVYGPQYSRWHAYNELDEVSLIEDGYEAHNIPLDVLVLDMDWHYTFNRGGGGCNPSVNGWTGYTWNKSLFPNPSRFLTWAKHKGLHITNNMHPAAGVQCTEQQYPPFALAMGVNPNTNDSIPYDIQNITYSSNFMDIVLAPLGGPSGIDYWWIDWQQGETGFPGGINPTSWVNYVFITSDAWWNPNDLPYNETNRPLIMARWGGYGNQRLATIGFSGDVVTSWDSLGWQPYFTATAANVGFSWSHDLGGFEGQPDPELYTRWIQWGTFSNFLRTHCDGKKTGGGYDRAIWLYPYENYIIMRDLFVLRSQLVPYIYTAAYMAHVTGVGIVHPMYYDYPEEQGAYSIQNEYMWGSSFFAVPITNPSPGFNISSQTIWIPPGEWWEWYTGTSFSGPQTIERNYTIEEVPVFVKRGSVIPMVGPNAPIIGSAQQLPTWMQLMAFPSMTLQESTTSFYYEDDGKTNGYLEGQGYITEVEMETIDNYTLSLIVSPASEVQQPFDGFPSQRSYTIQIVGVWPASSVMVNGEMLEFNPVFDDPTNLNENNWSYDTTTLSVLINILQPVSTFNSLTVKVVFIESINSELLSSGYQRSIRVLQDSKDLLDNEWGVYYPEDYPILLDAVGIARNMTINTAVPLLSNFANQIASARQEIARLSPTTPVSENCAAWLAMA